jgi:zinc and cadmium transporter
MSWLGVAVGLSLHTLIDGMALGASMQSDAAHGAVGGLFGLATFLAILLHKPLDAVSITSLMKASGWGISAQHFVNAGFALMCPLGAGLFFLGIREFSSQQSWIVGSALAFSAGVFLCISLGDLLPEVEFHSHDRVRLSLALLLGIALAWALGFLEPPHAHSHAARDGVRSIALPDNVAQAGEDGLRRSA